MHHENLTESDQDYIDNMDLKEAIAVFHAYVDGGWIEGNKEDERAFEIILEFLLRPEKHILSFLQKVRWKGNDPYSAGGRESLKRILEDGTDKQLTAFIEKVEGEKE